MANNNNAVAARKLSCVGIILFCIIGAIGGVGCAVYHGEYFIAVGVATLAYTAFSEAKSKFRELIS